MNCEDYQHEIAANPGFEGGAEHLAACESCRTWRRDMLALDAKIGRALELEVPALTVPELPAITADNVVALKSPRKRSAPVWLAMAASVVLAAALGVRMFGIGVEYESLADEVLAHIDHEPSAMRVTAARVTDGQLRQVVSDDIAEFDPSEALITYAHTCVINGKQVPHLVIQGERGPVMILLLPDEHVDEAIPLLDDVYRGVILPVGNGSIAIVGGREERLDAIESAVLNSVTWST